MGTSIEGLTKRLESATQVFDENYPHLPGISSKRNNETIRTSSMQTRRRTAITESHSVLWAKLKRFFRFRLPSNFVLARDSRYTRGRSEPVLGNSERARQKLTSECSAYFSGGRKTGLPPRLRDH